MTVAKAGKTAKIVVPLQIKVSWLAAVALLALHVFLAQTASALIA